MAASVTVKCVACGSTRDVGLGEVPAGDVPMCEQCMAPMAPVRAESG